MKTDIPSLLGLGILLGFILFAAIALGIRMGEKSRLDKYEDSLRIEGLKLDIRMKKNTLSIDSTISALKARRLLLQQSHQPE